MNHDGMNHGQSMQQSGMNGISHNMDLGPADVDYDLHVIDAMIPHHEGALVMAQDLARKTQRLELQKLAQDMMSAHAVHGNEFKGEQFCGGGSMSPFSVEKSRP
jgi:uncharacterized protein (DUF305 family)